MSLDVIQINMRKSILALTEFNKNFNTNTRIQYTRHVREGGVQDRNKNKNVNVGSGRDDTGHGADTNNRYVRDKNKHINVHNHAGGQLVVDQEVLVQPGRRPIADAIGSGRDDTGHGGHQLAVGGAGNCGGKIGDKIRNIHTNRPNIHVNTVSNIAVVDGAGRADVGQGANVGDLVDGAHQLEVGGRDRGQIVQLNNRKIGGNMHTDRQIERKFKSLKLCINADMDGAGRTDVGHGAEVGDLVDGAHQLEVGGRGHVQLIDPIGNIIHRQIDNERKFKSKSGDDQTGVKLRKTHRVHGAGPPVGDGEDGADPGEVGHLPAGGGHSHVRHVRQEDLAPPTPAVGEPKGAEMVPVCTMGTSRQQKSPYEMAHIKQQQLDPEIQMGAVRQRAGRPGERMGFRDTTTATPPRSSPGAPQAALARNRGTGGSTGASAQGFHETAHT